MPDIAIADGAARVDAPTPRGPFDGLRPLVVPGRLRVAPAPHSARLLLRGDPAALGAAFGLALPTQPCRAAAVGERAALWLGPDEWLLLAPPGAADVPPALDGGAAVDVGHRQVGLVLEGPGAADALATGCPLDLHPSAFPPGMCTRTVFGKSEIVLWRPDADRFRLEVWRSFAAYALGRLRVAAAEIALG